MRTQVVWVGVTVVQAKHTNATNVHFSDAEFGGDAESSVITKEIVRIKALVDEGEVDNYILFANRRLGGVTAAKITKRIAEETGLGRESVHLAGTEFLGELMHAHPDLVRLARIDPLDGPLLASSQEIAEVILAIKTELEVVGKGTPAAVVDRVSYRSKNEINNMSPQFAEQLSKRYLLYTRRIEDFLADPANADALANYEAAVEDFQLKIVASRSDFQSFDDVFNYLVDLLIKRDGVLASNRRMLRAMVFYMYWHCDIGESVDAPAQ
jgi:hypothetical protein